MADLREAGIEPVALAALLARLGTSDPVEPVTSLAPLIAGIDFARFRRAPARFDAAELALLNHNLMHHTHYLTCASRLAATIIDARYVAVPPDPTLIHQVAALAVGLHGTSSPHPRDAS